MTLSKDIFITVVEDDASFRTSVEEMLNQTAGLTCVSSFADTTSFLQALPTLKSDIYWLDISLPDGSGIDLIKQIKSRYNQAFCLICSLHDDDDNIFNALKAGADGYILKNASAGKMVDSIFELMSGGSPMSSFIARKVMQSFREPVTTNLVTESLSTRETEVLQLTATGLLYKEVAEKLNISTETVKKHIQNIYRKLQVQNKTEAVLKYLNR